MCSVQIEVIEPDVRDDANREEKKKKTIKLSVLCTAYETDEKPNYTLVWLSLCLCMEYVAMDRMYVVYILHSFFVNLIF